MSNTKRINSLLKLLPKWKHQKVQMPEEIKSLLKRIISNIYSISLTSINCSLLLSDLRTLKNKGSIERQEDIEIIRFLELNKKVLMVETKSNSHAVDTKGDIAKIEKYLKK